MLDFIREFVGNNILWLAISPLVITFILIIYVKLTGNSLDIRQTSLFRRVPMYDYHSTDEDLKRAGRKV